MFIPVQGKVVHITGVIAEVADGTAVILTEKGRRVTAEFGLNGNIPETGTVVTVVGRLDPDANVLRVRSVHRVSKTLKRLSAHIDKVRDSTPDRKRQIKHVTRTRRLLENLSSRQVQIVNKVLERSPEAAQPALACALRNLEDANQAVARAIDQAIVLAGHQEREKRQREQGKPKVHNLPKDVKPTIDDIAAALDLTKDALLDLLSQDAALAQIVHESGLDTEAFRQNVVAIVVERLQALAACPSNAGQ